MGASTIKSLLVMSLLSLAITGCSGDMDDLDEYINTVKARPGGRIDPLPEITPYEVFTYKADIDGLRSPFVPDSPQAAPGWCTRACWAACGTTGPAMSSSTARP